MGTGGMGGGPNWAWASMARQKNNRMTFNHGDSGVFVVTRAMMRVVPYQVNMETEKMIAIRICCV
jgi:hypothetical protein